MALTLEQFVSIVQASGLISHAQLDAALKGLGGMAARPEALKLAAALEAQGLITTWQGEKLLSGVHQGFFLGKHKLLRLLASGSMSSVYEAEHVLMHRRVALKVLPKTLVGEASFLERFYREARAVARLDHPNIIRGFDVGQDGDYHYFVMEYVEGSNLQEMVEAAGPLPLAEAAEMIRQAALGLDHAHKAGLIHRDIKPSNLLRDLEGTIKILDLGLVRSLPHEIDGELALTRIHDDRVLGTVDYLSPEQAIDSHNVDIRSDIYSLGCTLYFVLTGGPPFASGTMAERLLAHQTKSPIPVAAQRPEIPKSLAQIVARTLAKRPDDRYQTPEEVAYALGDWLASNREPATSEAARADAPAPRSGVSKASSDRRPEAPEGQAARIGRHKKTETRPLPECWERWGKVVEKVAARGNSRISLDEATYREIYEDLLKACRVALIDADEPTRLTLRRIEDLAAPWPTLRSLQSILSSGMSDNILAHYYELDPIVRARSNGNFFRRFFGKVFAPLMMITPMAASLLPG